MGRLESALKEEILRLSKKQARALLAPHIAEVRRLKKRIGDLQVEVSRLKRERAKDEARSKVAAAVKSVSSKEGARARLSPGLIKKLRKRLNISQPDLALLVDVSPAAVGFWETGKSSPRPNTKARLVALRSLGRRDAKRLLEEKKSS